MDDIVMITTEEPELNEPIMIEGLPGVGNVGKLAAEEEVPRSKEQILELLRRLKAEYGDKILFNGAIDSHHVLIRGTPELVRRKTREVLEVMMPGGGYVAGASHDYILEETPLENVLAMFDVVKEYR